MRRVHAWLHALGPAGVIGIGVLLSCLPFYFSAVQPAERELQGQRSAAERLRARVPIRSVSEGGRGEELRRVYALFPPLDKLPDQLAKLYALAQSAGLELLQGDYRLEKPPSGIAAYRITLPTRGSYPQIRQFVGALLKDMPTVSLDAMRFERKRVGDPQLEAQLRLSVHFRPADGGDLP